MTKKELNKLKGKLRLAMLKKNDIVQGFGNKVNSKFRLKHTAIDGVRIQALEIMYKKK